MSAYIDAISRLSDQGHLLAAASILSTESLQASWVAATVNQGTPWGSAFQVSFHFDAKGAHYEN
jgi:hypothetical protein